MLAPTLVAPALGPGCGRGGSLGLWRGCRSRLRAEPGLDRRPQRRRWRGCRSAGRGGRRRYGRRGRGCDHRRRCGRHDAAHHGLLARLAVARLGLVAAVGRVQLRRFGALEARPGLVEPLVVVAQALDLVVRRLQVLVRNQHDRHAQARLDLGDVHPLLVEQEGCHLDRHLHVHGRGAFLHRLFLQDTQHVQSRALGVADHAHAVAARAGDVRALVQGRAQALARQLHQAEARDLAHLHAGTVEVQRVLQALLDGLLVLRLLHVDEVDDDQAAQVAQAQLAGGFLGRLQVGLGGGLLDVGTARGPRRVDVDGHQRLGVVDHDGAARGQRHGARVRRLDLVLDLEAREQRYVVLVALDAWRVVRHHVQHELTGLLVDVVRVDQDLADRRAVVVADGADHEVRFLEDQERRRVHALVLLPVGAARLGGEARLFLAGVVRVIDLVLEQRSGGFFDRLPECQQVVQVPLQFLDLAADPGGARDDAHALRQVERVDGLAQFLPVLALDPARYAAAARVVGHQHQVAARQRDEGGQSGALVAALLLFDLDDQLLAFGDRLLDAGAPDVDALAEVAARDLLERQEAVAFLAVVDETGLERRLDAGDDPFVDVGLALLAAGGLDVDVHQPLAVHDGHAQLFGVRGVEQHPLHSVAPCAFSGRLLPKRRRSRQARRHGAHNGISAMRSDCDRAFAQTRGPVRAHRPRPGARRRTPERVARSARAGTRLPVAQALCLRDEPSVCISRAGHTRRRRDSWGCFKPGSVVHRTKTGRRNSRRRRRPSPDAGATRSAGRGGWLQSPPRCEAGAFPSRTRSRATRPSCSEHFHGRA